VSAIISVTTIPDRIGKIGPCLESLVAQGLPVYLWAVPKIERSETRMKSVPKFPGVNVEVVADCGPITKLLPALKRNFDVILTADDDVIYGEGWAARLLAWAEKLPDGALGYRGRRLRDGHYSGSAVVQYQRIDKPRRVDLITGVYGALYRREHFDEGIYNEWKEWPMNDDLLIAAHLKRRGVPCYIVPGSCKLKHMDWQHATPLYRVNRRKGDKHNDKGVQKLGLDK
jgi:hypothetical protein